MLRLCGAELVEVPAVPYANPNNYQHVGRRLADELRKSEPNGVLFADQWNNLDNRKAHYVSTGPEIWEQTDGKVDGFICSIGTGGTLAGVSSFLREKKKDIVIGVADPKGAAMYNCSPTARRRRRRAARSPKASGSAASRPIIEDIKVDKAYLIPDEEAVPIIFDLLEHEGLCMGGSTGINVAGAIRLAQGPRAGPHHRHHPCRLRRALSVEAVQSGIPALEGPAGAGMARAAIEPDGSICLMSPLEVVPQTPLIPARAGIHAFDLGPRLRGDERPRRRRA